jgi:hypothetical protein
MSEEFDKRRSFHLAALLAAVPESEDVGAWVAKFGRSWHRAEEMALADGYKDPSMTLKAPSVPMAEVPLSVLDVERLPAVARRPRPAASHDAEPPPRRPSPTIDAAPVHDPLGPFRGAPSYDGPIFPDN